MWHKRGFADTKERGREGEETSFHFPYSSYGDREEKRMSFFPFPLSPGHISWIIFCKKKVATVCFGAYRTDERVKKPLAIRRTNPGKPCIIISLDVYGKTATVAACDLFRRKEEEEGKVRLTAAARSQTGEHSNSPN